MVRATEVAIFFATTLFPLLNMSTGIFEALNVASDCTVVVVDDGTDVVVVDDVVELDVELDEEFDVDDGELLDELVVVVGNAFMNGTAVARP